MSVHCNVTAVPNCCNQCNALLQCYGVNLCYSVGLHKPDPFLWCAWGGVEAGRTMSSRSEGLPARSWVPLGPWSWTSGHSDNNNLVWPMAEYAGAAAVQSIQMQDYHEERSPACNSAINNQYTIFAHVKRFLWKWNKLQVMSPLWYFTSNLNTLGFRFPPIGALYKSMKK